MTKTCKNPAWLHYRVAVSKAKGTSQHPSHRAWASALIQATPQWLTDAHWQELGKIYADAKTARLVVDHVVPLVGKDGLGNHIVCGLHVPWNLQAITSSENVSKGSFFSNSPKYSNDELLAALQIWLARRANN